LFQQFLYLSSSQKDMSGPILGALSNNRWAGGSDQVLFFAEVCEEAVWSPERLACKIKITAAQYNCCESVVTCEFNDAAKGSA
jgi:hypothetical protein